MRRREFIAGFGGAIAASAWSFAARAQQPARKRLVGLIGVISESEMRPQAISFRDRMRKLGWIEGRNITIEVRASGGNFTQLDADARALVDAGADAIVAQGSPTLGVINRYTKTVPVVFTMVADPVALGFIANLSRPGGNATGLTNFEFAIGGKWLELLAQVSGNLSRVTLLANPANANTEHFVQAIANAGKAQGVETHAIPVKNANDIESAINSAAGKAGGGLIIFPDFLPIVHHAMIIRLAEQHRLPAIYPFRTFTANGGLISYGLDTVVVYHQAAEYVDRILRGAKPAELPVEAPNKFELIINLRAAKALGLTVPTSLLVAADEVIE